jgi:predicted RNase H-like HicB family nuclease
MIKKKYIYWQDDDMWLGYLEEYPDYWTQGETEEELKENLLDIYNELTSGTIQSRLMLTIKFINQNLGDLNPLNFVKYSSFLLHHLAVQT